MTEGKLGDEILTLFARAMMTLPRLARLLLMFCVSLRRWPCDPDSFSRSLPARSTRFSTPSPQHKTVSYHTRKQSLSASLCQSWPCHITVSDDILYYMNLSRVVLFYITNRQRIMKFLHVNPDHFQTVIMWFVRCLLRLCSLWLLTFRFVAFT